MPRTTFVMVGLALYSTLWAQSAAGQSAPPPLIYEGATITAVGQGALSSNIDVVGFNNTAIGAEAMNLNTRGEDNTASGYRSLYSMAVGYANTASGAFALFSAKTNYNTASGYASLYSTTQGGFNTATGAFALSANSTGNLNTASGYAALQSNTTGVANTAVGSYAGYNPGAGSWNVFIGANVVGAPADTNTIRIGLPYDSAGGIGQNATYIAGIHGTQLTGPAAQVFVDANGQLGTFTPPIVTGSGTAAAPLTLEQRVQAQQAINTAHEATIAELRARLARLEAVVAGRARRE